MKVPIVLKTAPEMPAAGRLYYEIAENGIFQVRDTELYRAVTRATPPLPGLRPSDEELIIRFPPLPRSAVEDALALFHAVNAWCGGEAVLIIFYAAARREYRLVAPPQHLPGRWRSDGRWWADYAVRYTNVPRPDGFVRFGTIHSHADLPAFASGLDCDDERYEDGLHIVFGNFGSARISVEAAFVAGGVRFELAPADVLEEADVPRHPARADWMASIVREDLTLPALRPAGATMEPDAGRYPAAVEVGTATSSGGPASAPLPVAAPTGRVGTAAGGRSVYDAATDGAASHGVDGHGPGVHGSDVHGSGGGTVNGRGQTDRGGGSGG